MQYLLSLQFYMITFGVDIAKQSNNWIYLLVSLIIDILAMSSIVLGVRGVALELWRFVLVFIVVIVLVTVSHTATFLFRHTGLNSANFFFDLTLSVFAIVYAVFLYRFEKLKPIDYDLRQRMVNDNGMNEDEEIDGMVTCNRTSTVDTSGVEYRFESPNESKLTEVTAMELSDVIDGKSINTTTINQTKH